MYLHPQRRCHICNETYNIHDMSPDGYYIGDGKYSAYKCNRCNHTNSFENDSFFVQCIRRIADIFGIPHEWLGL